MSELLNRITVNPELCGGSPVIRGLRIPVSVILAELADGSDWDGVLRSFPLLEREDIQAALLYSGISAERAAYQPSVLHSALD